MTERKYHPASHEKATSVIFNSFNQEPQPLPASVNTAKLISHINSKSLRLLSTPEKKPFFTQSVTPPLPL